MKNYIYRKYQLLVIFPLQPNHIQLNYYGALCYSCAYFYIIVSFVNSKKFHCLLHALIQNYILMFSPYMRVSVQEEEIKLKPVIAFDCGKFFLWHSVIQV
jgi:hypothetical protein